MSTTTKKRSEPPAPLFAARRRQSRAERVPMRARLASAIDGASGTLQERVLAAITNDLIIGRFAPGEKITLRRLAAVLGTSAMPVRDALQRLESSGALTMRSNRTMVVPVLSMEELEEICDVRISLESLVAGRAAQRCTQRRVEELSRSCLKVEKAALTGDLDGFLHANWSFHMAIAEASQSPLLTSILKPLWLRIGPTIRLTKTSHKSLLATLQPHRDLRDAIARGDATGAAAAMTKDIRSCFTALTSPFHCSSRQQQEP